MIGSRIVGKSSFRYRCMAPSISGIFRNATADFSLQSQRFSTRVITSSVPQDNSVENSPSDTDVISMSVALSVAEDFRKEHQIRIQHNSRDLSQQEQIKFFPITTFSPEAKNSVRKIFHPSLWKGMLSEGYSEPTPIQAQSWPVILAKRDLISVARTGSGKTVGFLLPAFQKILNAKSSSPAAPVRKSFTTKPPSVLILAPTRELVVQIEEEAQKYCRASNGLVKALAVYGGASKGPQISTLRSGVDIVIATPGRCNDLQSMGCLNLSAVDYFVLDEADRMLDMGFEPQIRSIVETLPPKGQGIQTSFFTATWPKEVQNLAMDFVHDPVQINVGDTGTLNANKNITQNIMVMSEFEKEKELFRLLQEEIRIEGSNESPKIIIFISRKADCDELADVLCSRGFAADSLHGDKAQASRSRVLDRFRSGHIKVLVATDVAGRGLDVKDIDYVINFDFPNGVEDYVHRIGRTARAGKKGVAYTFLTPANLKNSSEVRELVGVLQRCNQVVPAELSAAASDRGRSQSSRPLQSRFGAARNRYSQPGDYSRTRYTPSKSSFGFNFDDEDDGPRRRPQPRDADRNRRSFWDRD